MLLAASVNTFGYKLFLLLHILAVIVAFAPALVASSLRLRYKSEQGGMPNDLTGKLAQSNLTVYGPALVLAGIFGFGLIGFSKSTFDFTQPWISVAMLLWFLMLGLVFGLIIPNDKRIAAGDSSAVGKASMFTGILNLLLIVMLIDMIWKPGF